MSRVRIAQKITFLPWFDLRCSELHDMFKVKINNILPIYFCRKQYELAKIGAIHHVYYICSGAVNLRA